MIFKEFCGQLWMDRMNISWSPTIIEVPACVNKAIPRFTEHARAELDGKMGDKEDGGSGGNSRDYQEEQEETDDSEEEDEEESEFRQL